VSGDFRGVWIEFKPNSTGRNVKCDRVTVSNSPEEEVYKGMFGQKEALYSADLETIAAEELADADHADSS
jgi:hypothetical protein